MGGITVLVMLVIIGLGLMHHEYGHMHECDKRGLECKEYCVGMGPKLFSRISKKNGRKYSLALLPIGGYCDIPDKELEEAPTKDAVAILLAGVIRNFADGVVSVLVGSFLLTGIASAGKALYLAFSTIFAMIPGTITVIAHAFDFKMFAEEGGVITSVGDVAVYSGELGLGVVQAIGLGLLLGGALNIALAIFNAIPIPCLDGGRIVQRLICDGIRKTGREPNQKLLFKINAASLLFILGYQALFFAFDIPAFRTFVLNFFA